MTSPYQYGAVQQQSPADKALSSINRGSYAYKQQGEITTKLIGDVSFIAQNQRQMQKGIEEANENFIQQAQGLINDVIVLVGGGSPDNVLELGDLKYVLQGIGALFGLGDGEGGIQLPFNLFNAASHFINQFLFPALDWEDGFSTGIDNFISIMLNVVDGIHVPFITQAAQEFAVLLSGFRDDIIKAINWIEDLFDRNWKIIQAIWDWVFGTGLYNGTPVEPFSPLASAHIGEAWNNYIQLLFPGVTTPTTNKGALGSSIFNGLFPSFDFTLDIDRINDGIEDLNEWVDQLFDDLADGADRTRRAINSAIQPLKIGYWNSSWTWTFGTPSSGDLFSITSGSGNNNSGGGTRPGGGSSTYLNSNIPQAPGSITASWASTGFAATYPSGDIYHCVTAVKNGIEGPPSDEVKLWVAGLGVASINVTLDWPAVSGVDGYNVYRRIVSIFGDVSYRRLNGASATANLITSTSYLDTVIKTGGTSASPPTRDQLDAIVIDTGAQASKTAADSAIVKNQTLINSIVDPSNTTDDFEISDVIDTLGTQKNMIYLGAKFAAAPRLWETAGDVLTDYTIPVSFAGTTWSRTYALKSQAVGMALMPLLGGPKKYLDIFVIRRTTDLNNVVANIYELQSDDLYHLIWTRGNIVADWPSTGAAGDGVDETTINNLRIEISPVIEIKQGGFYWIELVNRSTSATVRMHVPIRQMAPMDSNWRVLKTFYARADSGTNPSVLPAVGYTDWIGRAALSYGSFGGGIQANSIKIFNSNDTYVTPTWWRPGIDYLDIVVLPGGGSGGVGTLSAGNSGGASSVSYYGGSSIVSASGGAAGLIGNANSSQSVGKSPGILKYSGYQYAGGTESSIVNNESTAGVEPGGASSGAYAGGYRGYGGSAGLFNKTTIQPATNYTDPTDGKAKVRLSVVVGAGGAARNSGFGWGSKAGAKGRVWIIAKKNNAA